MICIDFSRVGFSFHIRAVILNCIPFCFIGPLGRETSYEVMNLAGLASRREGKSLALTANQKQYFTSDCMNYAVWLVQLSLASVRGAM